MSIHTLTLDEFMRLTKAEHEEALEQYDKAISGAAQELVAFEVNYDDFANDRDRLGRLLTLRKVHQVCLDELEAAELADTQAEPAAEPLASQQWGRNELQPALV